MKTISEYFNYLDNLNEKTADAKTKSSIQKLKNLLMKLNERKIFDGDAHLIIERLEILEKKHEQNPKKLIQSVWNCYNAIISICAKFYNLVTKGKHQSDWSGMGMSLGMMFGVVVYASTNEVAYIGLGMPFGLFVGWIVGAALDRKAKNENRVLQLD
jgi:hypothetical protein